MFFWFLALSVLVVWQVFQSPALDFRWVVVGSVLPLAEVAWGGPRFLHALACPVLVMLMIMIATRNRRLVRRSALGLPIGLFMHLVLDGVWTDPDALWWPLFGTDFGDGGVPELSRGVGGLVLEVVGIAALVWMWGHFGFGDPGRRAAFLRTGRLPRTPGTSPTRS